MPSLRRHTRSAVGPLVEVLEGRQLCTASTVSGTDPLDGARLRTSPAQVTVSFFQPIDVSSLGNADIMLDQVVGGSLNWISDAVEGPGSDPNQITLTLSGPLVPGEYQIILAGSSGLSGLDGSLLASPDGNDQMLADFMILNPGITTAAATDLGALGPTPLTTTGALDLLANPEAVNLYRFTVPDGHFWKFGAQVTAQATTATLAPALALFDEHAQPIATDDQSWNGQPGTAFVFAGLKPGTYYVGVSGIGNVPGLSGGYDLANGIGGLVAQTQPGGPYAIQLAVAADDTPPTLRQFTVNKADPINPSPTGLTLGFSSPIGFRSQLGALGPQLNQGIELVDENGKVFPVVASGLDESAATVSYLFQSRLPAGHYTVKLPAQGALSDLAGLSPVAPSERPGVLGSFTVASAASNPFPAPDDLGALLPRAASTGITLHETLAPGQVVRYRVVTTFPALYTFQDKFSGGAVAVTRLNPDGTRSALDAGRPDAVNGTNDMLLAPGVYQFQIADVGTAPATFSAVLRVPIVSFESILDNGLGQGSPVNLVLFNPVLPSSPQPVFGPFSSPSTPSPSGGGLTNAGQNGARGSRSEPGGPPAFTVSGLILTPVGALAGAPLANSVAVSAVGPLTPSAMTALAQSPAGLLQGIIYGQTSGRPLGPFAPGGQLGESELEPSVSADHEVMLDESEKARAADLAVIDQGNLLERLRRWLPRWSSEGPTSDPAPAVEQVDPPGNIALTHNEAGVQETHRASLGLETPLEIGLIAGLALGYQRWRRSKANVAPMAQVSRCYIPPPKTRHRARLISWKRKR